MMRLGSILAVLLLALASPASAAPLQDCIAERLPAAGAARNSLESLSRVRHACYEILGDERRVRRLAAEARMYEHQIVQNNVLLAMVVVITLSGLLLAGLQLLTSYRLAEAGKGALADGGEVTINNAGLVVKSSTIGVVILGLSLAFFAIYVVRVYEIDPAIAFDEPEVPAPATSPAAASTAGDLPPPPAGMTVIPR